MENSLFGALPAELRNDIYEYLLPSPTEFNIEVYRGAPQNSYGQAYDDVFAFARSCKGVAAELLGLFYSQNKFNITVKPFYCTRNGSFMLFGTPRKAWVSEVKEWIDEERGLGKNAAQAVNFVVPGEVEIYFRPQNMVDEQVSEILALCVRTVREMFCQSTSVTMSFGILCRSPSSAPNRSFDLKLPVGSSVAIKEVLHGHQKEQEAEHAALGGKDRIGFKFAMARYPDFYTNWWARLEAYFVVALGQG